MPPADEVWGKLSLSLLYKALMYYYTMLSRPLFFHARATGTVLGQLPKKRGLHSLTHTIRAVPPALLFC
jgi:hypothetical protein